MQRTKLIMQDMGIIIYINSSSNLESTHPGATAEIEALTSVRRNTIGIGQAMDLTGEQTY